MQSRTRDPQKEAKKRSLQMEAILRESEYRKNERKKTELEGMIRELKRKKIQLEMDIKKAEGDMARIGAAQIALANEMRRLKREVQLF